MIRLEKRDQTRYTAHLDREPTSSTRYFSGIAYINYTPEKGWHYSNGSIKVARSALVGTSTTVGEGSPYHNDIVKRVVTIIKRAEKALPPERRAVQP